MTNPISDALSEIQHFEDIAKAVEMINNQVEQINTLTQQLQQIQAYVKAFGDPEQLLSIVGADELISQPGAERCRTDHRRAAATGKRHRGAPIQRKRSLREFGGHVHDAQRL